MAAARVRVRSASGRICDSAAGEAKDDPVPYANVLASVYKNLGIDPHAMVYDVSNRPNPILPGAASTIDKLY